MFLGTSRTSSKRQKSTMHPVGSGLLRCVVSSLTSVEGSPNALPSLGFANDICEEIDSDLVFEMIADWISECDCYHGSCFHEGTSSPKRLLHVQGDIPSPDIRLEQDLSEPVRYIALSHCWGCSTAFTTTTETLAQRLTGISWDELPQTFKDAITVALRLEIPYLWIDSLCILQDDQ